MDIPKYELDLTANNSANLIVNETMPTTPGCPWIIPNGSPFFTNDVVVADAKGAIVSPSRYELTGNVNPLVTLTGKRVVSFIKFKEEDFTTNNETVTITYRTVGDRFIPRNMLQTWLDEIANNNNMITWTDIWEKPDIFPVNTHIHDIKTEVTDYSEMTDVLKSITNSITSKTPDVSGEYKKLMDDAIAELLTIRTNYMEAFRTHDERRDNPHGTTKAHLGLTVVPNYKTATLAEDAAGTSETVFSTPLGIKQSVLAGLGEVPEYLETGVYPVSNVTFPPKPSTRLASARNADTITCFAGHENTSVAMCPIRGRLDILVGHTTAVKNESDGGTLEDSKGLFFYHIPDFFTTTPDKFEVLNSYKKYSNPDVTGITFDHVIGGSDDKVMMLGNHRTNNYYITLTNGTLDGEYHKLSKITNMGWLRLDVPDSGTSNDGFPDFCDRCRIIYSKDKILLLVTGGETESSNINKGKNSCVYFYYINTTDLGTGDEVTFQPLTFDYSGLPNYQDTEHGGTYGFETNCFMPYEILRTTEGGTYGNRYAFHTITNGVNRHVNGTFADVFSIMGAEVSDGVINIKFGNNVHLLGSAPLIGEYDVGENRLKAEFTYSLNLNTGKMTLLSQCERYNGEMLSVNDLSQYGEGTFASTCIVNNVGGCYDVFEDRAVMVTFDPYDPKGLYVALDTTYGTLDDWFYQTKQNNVYGTKYLETHHSSLHYHNMLGVSTGGMYGRKGYGVNAPSVAVPLVYTDKTMEEGSHSHDGKVLFERPATAVPVLGGLTSGIPLIHFATGNTKGVNKEMVGSNASVLCVNKVGTNDWYNEITYGYKTSFTNNDYDNADIDSNYWMAMPMVNEITDTAIELYSMFYIKENALTKLVEEMSGIAVSSDIAWTLNIVHLNETMGVTRTYPIFFVVLQYYDIVKGGGQVITGLASLNNYYPVASGYSSYNHIIVNDEITYDKAISSTPLRGVPEISSGKFNKPLYERAFMAATRDSTGLNTYMIDAYTRPIKMKGTVKYNSVHAYTYLTPYELTIEGSSLSTTTFETNIVGVTSKPFAALGNMTNNLEIYHPLGGVSVTGPIDNDDYFLNHINSPVQLHNYYVDYGLNYNPGDEEWEEEGSIGVPDETIDLGGGDGSSSGGGSSSGNGGNPDGSGGSIEEGGLGEIGGDLTVPGGSGSTVFTIPAGIVTVINGTQYQLPSLTVDLLDISIGDLPSQVFVHAKTDLDGVKCAIHFDKPNQNNHSVLLYTLNLVDNGLVSYTKHQTFSIANMPLTSKRVTDGDVGILHSTGYPMEEGFYRVLESGDL